MTRHGTRCYLHDEAARGYARGENANGKRGSSMNKLAVWALPLWLMAAACSSSDSSNNDPKKGSGAAALGTCTEEGETKCQAAALLTCVAGSWRSDACATGKTCGPAPGTVGVFACIVQTTDGGGTTGGGGTTPAGPGAEFAACDDTKPCATGLLCQSNLKMCVKSCTASGATSGCGTGQVCQPLSQTNPNAGICFGNTAQRDSECLSNGNMCAANQGTCIPVDDTQALACKVTCESPTIGTRGACAADELCLAAPGFVQPQDPQVTCATPGSSTGCNAAEGYTCFSLSGGTQECARRAGWCGTVVPMLGTFSQTGVQAHVTAGNTCDLIADHKGCGITGATGAPASADCVEVAQDNNGGSISVCIGNCDGGAGSPDLDCGTGYHCARPSAAQSFFFDVQQGSGGPVICTQGDNSACTAADSYTCNGPFTGNKFYCSRPAKVCMSNTP